jgi:hypothetical protein
LFDYRHAVEVIRKDTRGHQTGHPGPQHDCPTPTEVGSWSAHWVNISFPRGDNTSGIRTTRVRVE